MKYITKDVLRCLDIIRFIELYFDELQGAAVFVKNDKSLVSKVVSTSCKNQTDDDFIPSHIASCFRGKDGQLYILDIKPPKSTVQNFYNYISKTDDDFIIFLRQEKLDLGKYNRYMQERKGLWYGLLSAIQSIFKHITIKHGMHCSECYIYAYNQQGYYYDINANKSTPANLLQYMKNKYLKED